MTEIDEIADDIWTRAEEQIEALYLAGSRAVGAETKGSDYDFFGVVNEDYRFEKEKKLNQGLTEKYDEEIRLRGLSLGELNGGKQKSIITKYNPISVILKSFPNWKHLRGKEYSLEDFKVEPATAEEEARFYLDVLENNRSKAEKDELPMPFEDYVKNVLRLIGAEEQLEGENFTQDFEKMAERAPDHAKELAEICLVFRKTGSIEE